MDKFTSKTVALGTLILAISIGCAFGLGPKEPTAHAMNPPATSPTPPVRSPTDRVRQRPRTQFNPGIFGKISWKIEYGFPSIDGGVTQAKELNCTAFRVNATVQEGAPGTLGTARSVGYFGTDAAPAQVNGYYVCNYTLPDKNQDFPHGKVITVQAILGPYASAALNQKLTQGAWYGSGNPKPPAGYQRVPVGGQGVTLTDADSRATVDFVVEYRPLPSGPR
ncbi:MAG: hypothetical protein ABIP75_16590 [Pyrinomonadaceae bacterium]